MQLDINNIKVKEILSNSVLCTLFFYTLTLYVTDKTDINKFTRKYKATNKKTGNKQPA